ncbi:hypothetical protein GGR44_000765 [Sphingobium fontiphilum]|uniref:Uncharacterized protein n=1 Tax=Sphingobium fontiphilum TaxID=944425 RepID=A0A7W6DLB7_9SPHN|nr:hypothetical protein [Sphingobium fontiphilum]MBB3981134.1 hypothetical protein [Sphingobium fontiphilum]
MSRVIHVQATEQQIETLCQKNGFRLSVVEALLSGGFRVVMLDSRDSDAFRALMKGKVIDGPVKRSSKHIARQLPTSMRRQ